MTLSDEQIQNLLKWFIYSSEVQKKEKELRRAATEKNHKWIQSDIISNIIDEELEKNFLEYFNNGGGRQNLNKINRDRIIKDKKRFKETILFLLDESVDIKERIEQILEGKYKIEGFGRAILSSFLMDYNPNKYCLWNNKTDMGFSVLGWKVYENKDTCGIRYLKVLDALQKIRDIGSNFNLTLNDVDLFLHIISAEKEGIEAVRAQTNNDEIIIPEKEVESLEFAMEKYLEEFIESNFNKIDFGAKLELYQDAETNGRQYPTSIGYIDLLAIDNNKKEFVVIELKKGVSSDVVVGQILRYMGWVKEKLAKNDYSIRGIIIAKECDEKIKYALKQIPTVTLFIYNVSFDVKKII